MKHPYLTSSSSNGGDADGGTKSGNLAIFVSQETKPEFNTDAVVAVGPIVVDKNAPITTMESVSLSTNRSIKCYIGTKSSEAACIRIRLNNVTTISELKEIIQVDFDEQILFAKDLTLKYRDQDGDLVIITQRTTLEDILEFAVCLELHSSKVPPKQSLLGGFLDE